MTDRVDLRQARKRAFLKACVAGVAGVAMGLDRVNALGGTLGLRPVAQPQKSDKKWKKEAEFYSVSDKTVHCRKCPNECILAAGESGICRNRVNEDGKLYSVAYGNPCAVHVDPIEKKPFFHFLPTARAFSIAAAGCNLRCLNCQNWEISQVSPKETDNYDLPPAGVVDECVAGKCEAIAYTYSEPTTFYEYVLDTAKIARERKIRNLLKSNGYINEQPLRRLSKVLDAANIDLKSFDDSIYRRLSSGTLDPVLRTLNVLREEGVWLEITNLVIPTWTDDLDMIKRMCDWLCANGMADSPIHFSRFSPLYKLTQLPATPVSRLEEAHSIATQAGLKYVYIGNVPGHRTESTFCPSCKKMILERRGYTIGENHIKKGKCEYCRESIAGVWG
jgi:pyruvate formate lyase activating enzyme